MVGELQIRSSGDVSTKYDLAEKKLLTRLEQLLPQILKLGEVLKDVLETSQKEGGDDTGSSRRDILSSPLEERSANASGQEVPLDTGSGEQTTVGVTSAKTAPPEPSTQEKEIGTERGTSVAAKQEAAGAEGTETSLEGMPADFNTALSEAKRAGFDPSNVCDNPKSPLRRTNNGSQEDLRADCIRALLSKMLTRGSKEQVYARVAPFLKAIADKTGDSAFFYASVAFIDVGFKVAPNGIQDFSKICDSLGLTPEERASWEQKFSNLKEYV